MDRTSLFPAHALTVYLQVKNQNIDALKIFYACAVLLIVSCSVSKQATAPAVNELPQNISLNGKIFTALFEQRAGEYRALCFQGYNIARMRIEQYVRKTNKPLAIITDVDETILDNTPFAVKQAFRGKEYEDSAWYDWTSRGIADTMPGAANFLNYVRSKDIRVFYITNRDPVELPGTLANLRRFNLPDADEAHLLTRTGRVSSKEPRRQSVLQDHELVLLMGDNLADFSTIFERKPEAERTAAVNQSMNRFGADLIVFPNCNYGDWESSFYEFKRLSQAQRDSVLRVKLKTY